jgi:hypothetical protein
MIVKMLTCEYGHPMRLVSSREPDFPDDNSGWHWETYYCEICDCDYEEDVDNTMRLTPNDGGIDDGD